MEENIPYLELVLAQCDLNHSEILEAEIRALAWRIQSNENALLSAHMEVVQLGYDGGPDVQKMVEFLHAGIEIERREALSSQDCLDHMKARRSQLWLRQELRLLIAAHLQMNRIFMSIVTISDQIIALKRCHRKRALFASRSRGIRGLRAFPRSQKFV